MSAPAGQIRQQGLKGDTKQPVAANDASQSTLPVKSSRSLAGDEDLKDGPPGVGARAAAQLGSNQSNEQPASLSEQLASKSERQETKQAPKRKHARSLAETPAQATGNQFDDKTINKKVRASSASASEVAPSTQADGSSGALKGKKKSKEIAHASLPASNVRPGAHEADEITPDEMRRLAADRQPSSASARDLTAQMPDTAVLSAAGKDNAVVKSRQQTTGAPDQKAAKKAASGKGLQARFNKKGTRGSHALASGREVSSAPTSVIAQTILPRLTICLRQDCQKILIDLMDFSLVCRQQRSFSRSLDLILAGRVLMPSGHGQLLSRTERR